MHEQMTRYLRRLDLELHKFKMELEADNSGITGLIEKSKIFLIFFILPFSLKNYTYKVNLYFYSGSLDSEQSNITNQKENKYQLNRCLFGGR